METNGPINGKQMVDPGQVDRQRSNKCGRSIDYEATNKDSIRYYNVKMNAINSITICL